MPRIVEDLKRFVQQRTSRTKTLAETFTHVYETNVWQDPESRSGPGSRRDSGSVQGAFEALEMAYYDYGVRSMTDIPCGDFNWMPQFLAKHPDMKYQGYDIVPALIERNRTAHPDVNFGVLNIAEATPPKTDLIFCKDLLNHLSYEHVRGALTNMKKSGSMWLIASNNFDFENVELPPNYPGASRHLDICLSPLGYGAPVWRTHYLGLWRLADL